MSGSNPPPDVPAGLIPQLHYAPPVRGGSRFPILVLLSGLASTARQRAFVRSASRVPIRPAARLENTRRGEAGFEAARVMRNIAIKSPPIVW